MRYMIRKSFFPIHLPRFFFVEKQKKPKTVEGKKRKSQCQSRKICFPSFKRSMLYEKGISPQFHMAPKGHCRTVRISSVVTKEMRRREK